MRIDNQSRTARVEFFRDLYERAAEASAESMTELERCMRQYKGDAQIDGSNVTALTVRNITYEIVESQVSSDIPMPKADATSYSERRSRNAESIERLCRAVRRQLPFDELNDIDERYTYIYGGSVWYVDWDNNAEYMGEVGAVRVHCLSPRDFVPQPGICSVEDMEYCFLRFTVTKGEAARKYGVTLKQLELSEPCFEYDAGIPEGDAIYVTVCFYKDDEGDICRYVFSGELELSNLPKYYYRKGRICPVCGMAEGECDCGRSAVEGELVNEVLDGDVVPVSGVRLPASTPVVENGHLKLVDGHAVMKKTVIPYYTPKRFPIVIRKNTSGERSLFGQSDCDYIRPEQQAINKIESRILEKLIRAGITPIVPEDASITLNNSVFGQVIKMRPGESAAQYGKDDTTPHISQAFAMAERLYDRA